MKKKLLVKRILSIIIAVALLVSAVPVSLAVQNFLVEETTSKIVREATELREESVKHFLCEDGSYIAATYSAPVHYKENGEWKEIDNSLSLDRATLSESGKPTYTTKSGGLDVSIPQDFSDDQKITAKNKGYEIGFGVNSDQKDVSLKTSASVVKLETLSSNTEVVKFDTVKSVNNVTTVSALDSVDIEAYNAELMTVDNQSSAVTYKEIMPDTDFEYIVTSNSIKENIVVYEPKSEYTYSFDMDFDGLTPIINQDNSISLIEPNNPDETIFFIEAPYMYDSNSSESIDIEMLLDSNGDEYVMTLVANAEWINNPERVFPVVIDPTIQLLNSNISDVFVIDGLYANSPRIKNELRVGRNLTNLTRTYVKMSLPTIPVSSVITSANFTLIKDYFFNSLSAVDTIIRVYDCRNVAEWDSDTITWNNQPFGNSNNSYKDKSSYYLDEVFAHKDKTNYVFDITNAVKLWYDTGINNGLMFASSNEVDKVQVDFHSSRVSDSTNRPSMTFTYLPSGVNTSSVTFDATSSTSQPITVTSSKEWLITTNQPWITTTPSNGTGTASFVINVSENTSVEPRTGIVLISSGGSVIGTINVTQLGAASKVIVGKENLLFDCQGDSQIVPVVSNTSWNVFIEESAQNWLSAEKDTSGNIIIKASEYNGEGHRKGKITVKTNDAKDSKEITVKQLDYVDFYFNEIDSDGNIAYKSSSEYNHSLATWAMKLSYAAYNYPQGGDLPDIPGNFMGDVTEPATQIFTDLGFTNYQDYNYDESNNVAHVIAHRNIELTQEVEGVINDVYGYNIDYSGIGDAEIYTVTDGTGGDVSHTSSGNLVGESSNLQVNTEGTDNIRTLVVVSVRGSVSILDWIMNLCTQFHMCLFDFETGRDMVLKSLYGCDGNCINCIGTGNRCKGYLEEYDISDPIILVTGHSMGAAVANLVAAELNEIEGAGDVYGYTFATPYVKAYPLDAVITQPDNIFNILNTNDVVTYVPTSWLIPGVNIWSRYGIDIPLNMPYSEEQETAELGLYSHSMAVYMNWMENNKDITYEEILEKSSEATVRGLLPKFVQIKCPVGVTIKDSNGNIIAYESQEESITYPGVTNTGIVSWISDEGEKMFFVPSGVDIASVEIEAYDYGSMDFAIGTAGTTNESEIKVFNDVSLYPGKEFLVEVSDDVLPEDTRLFVTEDGEVVGEVTDTNPFFKGVTANPTEVVYGEPVTFTLVTDNTVTAMMLHNLYAGDHVNLVPGEGDFDVATTGENELTWTATYYTDEPNIGENIYDISVQSNGVWYYYENVIAVNVTVT